MVVVTSLSLHCKFNTTNSNIAGTLDTETDSPFYLAAPIIDQGVARPGHLGYKQHSLKLRDVLVRNYSKTSK